MPLKRDLIARGTSLLPLEWTRALSGVSLVVPYYHIVSDERVPHVSSLYSFRSITEFAADVEFFCRHFQPVSLDEIVAALDGVRPLPKACVHFTFDDGFREMEDVVAPRLASAGAAGTFFLNTAFLDGGGMAHHNKLSLILERLTNSVVSTEAVARKLESLLPAPSGPGIALRARLLSLKYAQSDIVASLAEAFEVDFHAYIRNQQPYLSSRQVESLLKQGFTIGAHSHDHPHYVDLSLKEQLWQTRTSMQFLKERFAVRSRAFAFPHNDEGVSAAFFDSAFGENLLDVSFGTSGLVPHFHARNIERLSMEKSAVSARQILARQLARASYYAWRNR